MNADLTVRLVAAERQVEELHTKNKEATELAVQVLTTMEQDTGPIDAEPYASWAKDLAEYIIATNT